jgi:uncharacterized protein DUF5076
VDQHHPLPENFAAGPRPLVVPADAQRDPAAFELVRVWSSNDRQYFVIDVSKIADPAAWGIFAVDLMKHAARAYHQATGAPKEAVYKRILAGLAAEIQDPTEPL